MRWNKDYLLSFADSHIIDYPSPINLSYLWSFGSTAGLCLVAQILTGIFLAMHYTPHVDLAFSSVEHRSEERRVGQECVSTCRSRWSPYHVTNKFLLIIIPNILFYKYHL